MRGKTIEVRVRTIQREATMKEENGRGVKRGSIVAMLRRCYI